MGEAVAEAVGQIGPTSSVQRAHNGVAQSGKCLQGGARTHLAIVLAKADITQAVGDILYGALRPFHDRPVTTHLAHLLPVRVYPLNETWNLAPAERHFNQHVKRDRVPGVDRLRRAQPHLAAAYGHYLASPALGAALRADAHTRFNGNVQARDFQAALAHAAVAFLDSVAQARSLPVF